MLGRKLQDFQKQRTSKNKEKLWWNGTSRFVSEYQWVYLLSKIAILVLCDTESRVVNIQIMNKFIRGLSFSTDTLVTLEEISFYNN